MKNSNMLTITSLLTFLLLTFHLAGDIVYGYEPGGLANLIVTVLISGVSASGCIRHSAEDCVAYGFRPIVVRDAVGDRVPGALEWNLFDIDAKVGDVDASESVLRYLSNLDQTGVNR